MMQPQHHQRLGSASSTRSRRDEVWEMKRQRWLARKRGEQAGQTASSQPVQQRHTAMSYDLPGHGAGGPPGSPSSLSRLMEQGYPTTTQSPSTSHNPYGERPASGSRPPPQPQSGYHRGGDMYGARGGHGMTPSSGGYGMTPTGGGSPGAFAVGSAAGHGFDAGIASQWSSNVQRDVHNRQNRYDPSVAGPVMPTGGQRVTQAPGGGSQVDLSWGAAQPPRMPGGGIGGYKHAPAAPSHYGDGRSAAGRAPSPAARGGFAAPWGRDDDNLQSHMPSRQTPVRREAPFGVDAHAPAPNYRSASRGRGISPSCRDAAFAAGGGGEAPAAGFSSRSRGRPPGGISQVVLG